MIRYFLTVNRKASIGIGALIVFIALVLVAGIAASVIIQTSGTLESQAASTGRETTSEVSTGLTVSAIEAYANVSSSDDISKIAILIRPRAGTDSIDLNTCYLELCNGTRKVILNYTNAYYSKPTGLDDLFNTNVFPDDVHPFGDANNRDGTRFGILILEDIDGSITSDNPVITRGDKLYLCINASGAFNKIAERTTISGMLVPEIGIPADIEFTTPGTYDDNVMELFWDM